MVELSWMNRFQVQVGLCWSNFFRICSGASCCMVRSLCKLSLSSTSHLELHRSNYVRRLSSELWSMYVRRTMLVDLILKLMLQYLGRTIRSSRTTSLELGSSIEFWIMIDVRSSNYVRRFDSYIIVAIPWSNLRSFRTIHQNYRVTVFSRSNGDLCYIKTSIVHDAISRKLWPSVYIILSLERKISLLWDLNPRPPAYWAGALPTKLKRQLMMWATPIMNEGGASNHIHHFKLHQYPSVVFFVTHLLDVCLHLLAACWCSPWMKVVSGTKSIHLNRFLHHHD